MVICCWRLNHSDSGGEEGRGEEEEGKREGEEKRGKRRGRERRGREEGERKEALMVDFNRKLNHICGLHLFSLRLG